MNTIVNFMLRSPNPGLFLLKSTASDIFLLFHATSVASRGALSVQPRAAENTALLQPRFGEDHVNWIVLSKILVFRARVRTISS